MALIPAVLEFSGVAKDASLSLTLATEGATWSIGGDDAHVSEGFSFNGLALDESRASCLTSIELTDSILSIRTSPSAAASTSFTLALFIDVQPEIESVQGHCTLNAGASVMCQLGYDIGAEWRGGPFSAIVRPMPEDIRRVRLNIQGALGGMSVAIDLMTEKSEGIACWCVESGVSSAAGLMMRGVKGAALPLQMLSFTDSTIVVVPAGQAGKVVGDIFIEAYVRRMIPSQAAGSTDSPASKWTRFHLRAASDPSATVVAQVHVQRPQYVAASYSRFYF